MVKFGDLHGVKQPVTQFCDMLKGLGTSGSFTFKTNKPGSTTIPVTDKVKLTLQLPITVDFEINGDVVDLTFNRPLPMGTVSLFTKRVEGVSVSVEKIGIKLAWCPDGYLEIKD